MTELEQWKQLAKAENKRMIEHCGGRSLNYGVPQEHTKGSGAPRMSEIKTSKPARVLLRLAEQGFSLAEAARITGSPVETVISRARRYQIKFKGGP